MLPLLDSAPREERNIPLLMERVGLYPGTCAINIRLLTELESNVIFMIFEPHNEDDDHRLVALLDSLIDEVGEDESHPLASLMEVVGILIEKYEDENVPELTVQ